MGSQGDGRGRKQTLMELLTNQSSLCNLTLNEFQSHLNEPLQSMNLDDLLKNVFPQQLNHSASKKKTVDEVLREIQPQDRTALGEMTLEDFLVKAGVVAAADGSNWFQRQCMMRSYAPSRPPPLSVAMGASDAVLGAVYPDARASFSSPLLSRRKRVAGVAAEEMEEKTVERRQKRMIKNRESAARSRARKQAYTNELENKILRLEEENERLKKQKELDTFLYCVSSLPEPKNQLRRSISSPF